MQLLIWILPILAVPVIVYFAYPDLLYRFALWFERFNADWKEGSIKREGQPIFYLDSRAGERVHDPEKKGDQNVLLMIHGFAGDRDNWNRLTAHLPRTYRRVALDLPGFGSSPLDSAEGTVLSAQVERLLAFMDAMSLERPHILGCSMGGQLAVHFAVKYPERVRSLLLFASSGMEEGRRSEQFQLVAGGDNPLAPSDRKGYDRMLSMLFKRQPFIPAPLKVRLAKIAIGHSAFFLKAWQVVFHDRYEPLEAVLPGLKKLSIPVQISWGTDDRIMHVDSLMAMKRLLPEAETHTYSDCGHLPFLEQPKKTAQAVNDFLTRHP